MPRLESPIQDEAAIFSPGVVSRLEPMLRSFDRAGIAQMAVLTVPTLQGYSIEEAAIRIVDQWKLGDAKKDNGLLFLISKGDRKIRIEVGQGLEGKIPDVLAKRIIDQWVTPAFKSGQFDQGLMLGVLKVFSLVDADFLSKQLKGSPDLAKASAHSKAPRQFSFLRLLIFFVLFLVILFGRMTQFLFIPHGRSSGRFGGGFGGGGFGGGGGGFSGGGASGGW